MRFEVFHRSGEADVLTFFLPENVRYVHGILVLPVILENCTYNGEQVPGIIEEGNGILVDRKGNFVCADCVFKFFLEDQIFRISYQFTSLDWYQGFWGFEMECTHFFESLPLKSFNVDGPLSLMFESLPRIEFRATV